MKTRVEEEIEELLSEGTRWNVIAKTLHVSNRTIAKVAKRMNEPTSPPPSVSEVFTKFDEGNSPMQIVKDTNADPTKIEEWFNIWLRMRESWQKIEGIARTQEKDGKEVKLPVVVATTQEKKSPDWREYFEKRET